MQETPVQGREEVSFKKVVDVREYTSKPTNPESKKWLIIKRREVSVHSDPIYSSIKHLATQDIG